MQRFELVSLDVEREESRWLHVGRLNLSVSASHRNVCRHYCISAGKEMKLCCADRQEGRGVIAGSDVQKRLARLGTDRYHRKTGYG